MVTCVAKREGKLIDARFLRPLDPRERSSMEEHLVACESCRERYRRLQLADRVIAFGPDADLDRPAPLEVERIALDLGLLDRPRRRPFWLGLPFFGAVGSVAAMALVAALFLRPSEVLLERGEAPVGITFSAYAIADDAGPRLLERGAQVALGEHLKLRASFGARALPQIDGIEVLLVPARGEVQHVHLSAPERGAASASVPGAIALQGLAPGPLTAYVVAAERFELGSVEGLASSRAPPEALARALGGASVERIDLEVVGP